jgi:hypothetical protein
MKRTVIAAVAAAAAATGIGISACGGSSAPQTPHHGAAPPPSASAPALPSGGGGTEQGSGQPVQPQQPGIAVLTCTNPVDAYNASNGSGVCAYSANPQTIYLAGDGSLYMTVSWASSNYGGQSATTTGEVYGSSSGVSGPYVAEGQGTVTVSDPVEVNGQWYYNDMTTTLPSTDVATGQPLMNYGPYTDLAP